MTVHVLQGEGEKAAESRDLGNFCLVDIPSAPCGVPQAEVAFDINANGIVHVSAKDLGTGKGQRVQMRLSGGTENKSQGDYSNLFKEFFGVDEARQTAPVRRARRARK